MCAVSTHKRKRSSVFVYLIPENLSGPRPSGPSKRACHTCHGVTRVAHVVELLVSRTLGLVDRRVLSAKTVSRTRAIS